MDVFAIYYHEGGLYIVSLVGRLNCRVATKKSPQALNTYVDQKSQRSNRFHNQVSTASAEPSLLACLLAYPGKLSIQMTPPPWIVFNKQDCSA